MDQLLENIIRQLVKKEINESVSDKVYHFTYPQSMVNILKSNEILLSPSYGIPADASLNYNKLYSLSLTTSRNTSIGFKGQDNPTLLTRIEMNGRELNYNYKSKHVDYWQSSRDPKTFNNLKDASHSNEMEERLITNKDRIKPATRYITKIETIVRDDKYLSICYSLKELADKLNIPCYFYDDAKSFNYSIIKNAIELTKPLDNNINNDRPYYMNEYAAIELLSLTSYKDEPLKKSIIAKLNDFGVENPEEKLNKRTHELKYNYMGGGIGGVGVTDLALSLQANIQNYRNTTDELTRYAIRMLGTDMRKQLCKNIKEYIIYKISKGKKSQKEYNQDFYKAIINVIDKSYQEQLTRINQYSFNSIEEDYYDNNVTKYVPELKGELDRIIFKIKEYVKKYILTNDDMFRYSYVLGDNNIFEELHLDNVDYAFANNIIDYQNSNISPDDNRNVIRYVLYDMNSFYYPYVQNMQKQYQEEWYSSRD